MVAKTQIDCHPRLESFLRHRGHYRSFTWLAMYGAETAKPVKLLSNDHFVTWLYRKLNRKKVGLGKSKACKRYVDRHGVLRYVGTKKLKSTQTLDSVEELLETMVQDRERYRQIN
ncbi:NEFH, partial [Symbiodinium pilosum]